MEPITLLTMLADVDAVAVRVEGVDPVGVAAFPRVAALVELACDRGEIVYMETQLHMAGAMLFTGGEQLHHRFFAEADVVMPGVAGFVVLEQVQSERAIEVGGHVEIGDEYRQFDEVAGSHAWSLALGTDIPISA